MYYISSKWTFLKLFLQKDFFEIFCLVSLVPFILHKLFSNVKYLLVLCIKSTYIWSFEETMQLIIALFFHLYYDGDKIASFITCCLGNDRLFLGSDQAIFDEWCNDYIGRSEAYVHLSFFRDDAIVSTYLTYVIYNTVEYISLIVVINNSSCLLWWSLH